MIDLTTMSGEELQTWVIDLLAEMFELDKASLPAASNLYEDLDIDSIDAVDLAVKFKELTGKRLQPEVFKTIRTVQDVVNAPADRLRYEIIEADSEFSHGLNNVPLSGRNLARERTIRAAGSCN